MLWKRALGVMAGLVVATARLDAQAWNEPRVRDLVQQATDRRVRQLTDSGLTGYQATAHGYVTFLAQIGTGFRELPRVVKADELALEVYWRAPNQSKQRIVGRRDTTLLPTDIQYHQDHLGIVQNNFPAIIRVGDGDEVRDVPHPLSVAGLSQYDFALTDSLRITTPSRVIDVYEVKVRPKNVREPRALGAIYLDRENAQVVRMAFSFTRPAYLDTQLEDVFVVLENGVVGGRYWLPRKQEIEIRRTVTWLDYPVRGIIRGRWDIGEYALTEAPAAQFFGPEIVSAPPAVLKRYAWPPGRLTDSLPEESKLPTPDEIKRTMDEVRRLVRARATQHGPLSLLARNASDFVRYDRTGGLALGAGAAVRLGRGWHADVLPRYASGEQTIRGIGSVGWESSAAELRVFAQKDVRDIGDHGERSRLVNSLAAQEFGSDVTDFFGVEGLGVAASVYHGPARWTLSWSLEEHSPMAVVAQPFAGVARPAFDPAKGRVRTALLSLNLSPTVWGGLEWQVRGVGRASHVVVDGIDSDVGRVALELSARREFGPLGVTIDAFGAAVGASDFLPAQDLVFLGGPVSAPGYPFHALMGDSALAQTIEARVPVPFPRVSLGRFGRSPARAALAVHWTNVWMHQVRPATVIKRASGPPPLPDPFRATATGFYRSAGVSLITGFDLLRFDVSRALPTGKWLFSVDVSRTFWSIL